MKIYIWEDVLRDYTAGMAVAYASDLETALDQFEDYIARELGKPTTVIDCEEKLEPYGVYVYGGG